MSISAAFNNALSGLNAAGRASEVVSSNVANATTPGYATRSLSQVSNTDTGGGVSVLGVTRQSDPALTANRRSADAELGSAQTLAAFHDQFETLVGLPGDAASIEGRLASFETSMIEAASRPDSAERLDQAVDAALDLAAGLAQASNGIAATRDRADRSIAAQVDRLNGALSQVQELNVQITSVRSSGGDTAALEDQRQVLIDEINVMVPVNEIPRDHGQVALYSEGGAILLDGSAAEIGFVSTGRTAPHMTVENGLLSGLEVNGIPIRTGSDHAPLGGGTLGAEFQIRDELAPDAQADLDLMAQDLILRFQDPGIDATLMAGDAGLFTDGTSALTLPADPGLAGRLSVNDRLVGAAGGASWRLRDGLGADTPGAPGDASLLNGLTEVLSDARPQTDDRFGTAALTAQGMAAALSSSAVGGSVAADQTLSFSAGRQAEFARIEAAQGVDTDAELQNLMVIEQVYAANARILEAVEQMMDELLRL